jgi:hypothetical protein
VFFRSVLPCLTIILQVAQLKAENSCLLRRIAALNQKYNDANVDNRVLRADMETLRAKVRNRGVLLILCLNASTSELARGNGEVYMSGCMHSCR